MAEKDGRKSVTIQQAMHLSEVSRRTIYNWMAENKIEYYRTPGGSVRIYIDSLYHQGNESE